MCTQVQSTGFSRNAYHLAVNHGQVSDHSRLSNSHAPVSLILVFIFLADRKKRKEKEPAEGDQTSMPASAPAPAAAFPYPVPTASHLTTCTAPKQEQLTAPTFV